jgi:hypothetical protein
MTKAELADQLLTGALVLVGEYRGSHAELAGYVDKKFGNAIQYVRATHLIERNCFTGLERVLLTERFPDTVTTVEQAIATFHYERGRLYAFYLESFKWERGQLLARKSAWAAELIEDSERAVASPSGEAPPF